MTNVHYLPPAVCCDCQGRLVYGPPLHRSSIQIDHGPVYYHYRCRHCSEQYAYACWPDDFGPCPHVSVHFHGRG